MYGSPAPAGSAVEFDNVEYIAMSQAGAKARGVRGVLTFDVVAKVVRFSAEGTLFETPFSKIASLVYERAASPRFALGMTVAWPLLFTKTRKHFLTVEYKDSQAKGTVAFFRLDKRNFREILATAESQTGMRVERHEE